MEDPRKKALTMEMHEMGATRQPRPPRPPRFKRQKAENTSSGFMSFDTVLHDAGFDVTPGFGDEATIHSSVVTRLSALRLWSLLPMLLLMPPIILSEACCEGGVLGQYASVRRLAECLTEKRLICGWGSLLLFDVVGVWAASTGGQMWAVVYAHTALLLVVPLLVLTAALRTTGLSDIRDANGIRRRSNSEMLLDVRPTWHNAVRGVSAAWVLCQFILFQFGVPVANHVGHSSVIEPTRSAIWTSTEAGPDNSTGYYVDTAVFRAFHYGIDVVGLAASGSWAADVKIVVGSVWTVLLFCTVEQISNSRTTKDAQHRSPALFLCHQLIVGAGLFCVVVTLVRSVTWFGDCDGPNCAISIRSLGWHGDDGATIPWSLYTPNNSADTSLCSSQGESNIRASSCTCVDRTDSRWLAFVSLITMSYFTIWATFASCAPSLATSLSSTDLDIYVPPAIESAFVLLRIVVASLVTAASSNADACVRVVSATLGALVILSVNNWLQPCNIRNMNQFTTAASSVAVWVGLCSTYAAVVGPRDQCKRAYVIGIGSITVVFLQKFIFSRVSCRRPTTAATAFEESLLASTSNDDEVSIAQLRPGYGMHSRVSLRRCKIFGLLIWAGFASCMVVFVWRVSEKCSLPPPPPPRAMLANASIDGGWVAERCFGANTCQLKDLWETSCKNGRSKMMPTAAAHVTCQNGLRCENSTMATMACQYNCKLDLGMLSENLCDPGWKLVRYERTGCCSRAVETCDCSSCSSHPVKSLDSSASSVCVLGSVWSHKLGCEPIEILDLFQETTNISCSESPKNKHYRLDMAQKSFSSALTNFNTKYKDLLYTKPDREKVVSPCITVCQNVIVEILGDGSNRVWSGAIITNGSAPLATKSNVADPHRVGIIWDVSGNLTLDHMRVNRSVVPTDTPTDTFVISTIRVQRTGYSRISRSVLAGINLLTAIDGGRLVLEKTSIVPSVAKNIKGKKVFAASSISVCFMTGGDRKFDPTQLCRYGADFSYPPSQWATVNVSESLMTLVQLFNHVEASHMPHALFRFSRTTFAQVANAKGPLNREEEVEDGAVIHSCRSNSENGQVVSDSLDPLFPVSIGQTDKTIGGIDDKLQPFLLETKWKPNQRTTRRRLVAEYITCWLAECKEKSHFCQPMDASLKFSTNNFATIESNSSAIFIQLNRSTPLSSEIQEIENDVTHATEIRDCQHKTPLTLDVLDQTRTVLITSNGLDSRRPYLNAAVKLKFLQGGTTSTSFCKPGGRLKLENVRLDCEMSDMTTSLLDVDDSSNAPASCWTAAAQQGPMPRLSLTNVTVENRHAFHPGLQLDSSLILLESVDVAQGTTTLSADTLFCQKLCDKTLNPPDPRCTKSLSLSWPNNNTFHVTQVTQDRSPWPVVFLDTRVFLNLKEKLWSINYNMLITGQHHPGQHHRWPEARLRLYGGEHSWSIGDGKILTLRHLILSAEGERGYSTAWRPDGEQDQSCLTWPQLSRNCPTQGPILIGSGSAVHFDHVSFEWTTGLWQRVLNSTDSLLDTADKWKQASISVFPIISLVHGAYSLSPHQVQQAGRTVSFSNCYFIQGESPFASFNFKRSGEFGIGLTGVAINPPLFLNATQFLSTAHGACESDSCNVSVAGSASAADAVLRIQRLDLPAGISALQFRGLHLCLRVGATCVTNWQGPAKPADCEASYDDSVKCKFTPGCHWIPADNRTNYVQLHLSNVSIGSEQACRLAAGGGDSERAVAGELWSGLTRCNADLATDDGTQWCVKSMVNVTLQEQRSAWAHISGPEILSADSQPIRMTLLDDSPRTFMLPHNLPANSLTIDGKTPTIDGNCMPLLWMNWSALNKSCPGVHNVTGVRLRHLANVTCLDPWTQTQSKCGDNQNTCSLHRSSGDSVCH